MAEGRYAEAEALFLESTSFYADYESVAFRTNYAEGLLGLASILRIRGEYPRAEQLLQQAIALCERFDFPDWRRLAAALEELGRLYTTKRDLRAAEPLLAQALAIREETRGPRHPERARSIALLGALHRLAGDGKRAGEELREALSSIQEERLDPAHPDRAETQRELGLLALEARDCERRATAARGARGAEKSLGAKHTLVAGSLADLAELHLRRRDSPRARSRCSSARSRCARACSGPITPRWRPRRA